MIAKLNVKKIKILGLIIISCFITLSFVKVDALELNYSGKPNAKVKKVSSTCDSKASSCKDITSKYSISIQNPNDNPNDNREKVVVKYTATKPTGFSSAPTANDFNVYVMINDTDGGIESFYKQAGSFTKVGSYYTMEFYITPTSNDQDLNVFVASANNEKCCEMPETDVRNIVNLYNLGHDLSPIKKSNGNIIDEYKGMHIDSRTITHTVDMEEIDYDYDSEYVADSALEYIEPFVSESGSPIVKPAGTEDRTNGSKDIAVKCDTFAINNKHSDGSSVSYAKDGQEYFINKKYYYSKEESDEQKDMGVCHKECEELISVEYGPPVASIGGFCFEYVVKVTSKQYCNTRFEGSKPDKSRFKTCTIYPKCNNSEQYSDQAGPNQDFDDCIMDCDGGKYTEKCTNKCYSKVYEETDSKLSLNYLDKEVNVASLAGTYNILTDKAVAVNTGNATTIKDLAKNNHPSGGYYYRASASEIAWNQDGAPYWLRAGRYYWGTTSRAERNLKLVSETGAGELRGGVWRHYFIDDGGFRRACKAGTSNNQHNCTNGCNEKCDWLVYSNGYCNTANLIGSNLNEYYLSGTKTDTIASRTYYNVRNANKATPATGSDKNQNSIYVFMNKEDTDYVYAAKVSEYKKEKKECEAATTCEKTHQSQFTISVDAGGNKNFPLEGTDIISTSNTWTGRVTNSSTILNENNGICMNPHDGSPYHYDVEWSFPGTWINNKNGDISYTSKENSAGWKLREDKFCLPLNTSNGINSNWYNWKLEYDRLIHDEHKSEAEAKSNSYRALVSPSAITYNISADAKDFGKYNWNINIQCFYATPPTCTDPPCDPYDYVPRTVDLANLFPADTAAGENNVTKTYELKNSSGTTVNVGREPGYNWTNAVESTVKSGSTGTNPNANEKYPVDPVALIKKIQDSETPGTGVKSTYDISNMDYKFDLNKEGLSMVKQYFKDSSGKDKNYGNFSNAASAYVGDGHGEMGISSYKSPLITKLVSNGYGSRNRKIGCNNSKDSHTCEVIQ